MPGISKIVSNNLDNIRYKWAKIMEDVKRITGTSEVLKFFDNTPKNGALKQHLDEGQVVFTDSKTGKK